MKKQKVTFKDIAEYTNFSKTTISRFFNSPESLTTENYNTIAQALKELGYEENKVGRILASGHTEFIGIVIPNLFLHYYAEMLNQILGTYSKYGYKFIVFNAAEDRKSERMYLQELRAYNIEGLIVLSHTLPSSELADLDLPVVGIEREDLHISSVNTNNYAGGVLAAQTLMDDGCDLLIEINSNVPRDIPAYGRITGFEEVCLKENIPFQIIRDVMGDGYDSLKHSLETIFETIEARWPEKKKGIFLSNDTYAGIFLNCIVRKYGTLPDTYRILGFDNSPICEETIFTLSTIGQNIHHIAQTAMEILTEQIQERHKRIPNHLPLRHEVIEPSLIVRQTAGHDSRSGIKEQQE